MQMGQHGLNAICSVHIYKYLIADESLTKQICPVTPKYKL